MAPNRYPADGLYKGSAYRPSHAPPDIDQESTYDDDDDPSHPRTEPLETLDISRKSVSQPPIEPNYVPTANNLERIGSLSALSSDFVKIRFDDFRGCSMFVEAEPQIIDEDLDALKHEALLAYGRGRDGLGERCMQRWLIIRECHGLSSRKMREFFDKLETRRSTYQNFQRDFSIVTQRLRKNAVAYTQQRDEESLSANPNADRTPRTATAIGPLYQSEPRGSIPIQIPRGNTGTYQRESEHQNPSRYMSFDNGRLGSPYDSSLAPSSNPYAEMNPASWSYVPPGQPLTHRPRPTQRKSSTGTTTQSPRSSLSTILPPIDDTLPGYHQPTPNGVFRGGTNNPYRVAQEATRLQRRTRSPTASERYPSGQEMLETPIRPERNLLPSDVALDQQDSPPGNPRVVIRPQETSIEPSLLPGSALDIRGGQTETSNQSYSVRHDGKNFFRAGRVFKIIWHAPAGTNRQGQFNQSNNVMDGPWSSKIYTKPLWMLVVFRKHGYSICCPISTYDGNGLSRKKLHQQEIRAHAVIHSSNTKARVFHDEPKMGKHPIPVDMVQGQPDLDKASRVHFGKFHTVEWNVFVMSVGIVKKGYEEEVRNNFLRELLGPNYPTASTGQT